MKTKNLLQFASIVCCALLFSPAVVQSFSPKSTTLQRYTFSPVSTLTSYSPSSYSTCLSVARTKNFLMDDFCTADGKIINPYATLKIDRHASRTEIRTSYRHLSKKYHPDAARFREIMPGKCDTLDEVRDEWERIKLSYEILSDQKLRMKYDRQSALNDPGLALGRAAFETVSWGIAGLAKGIYFFGKQALSAAAEAAAAKQDHSDVENKTRDEAIVRANKRRKRKQPMVQHIELDLPNSRQNNIGLQQQDVYISHSDDSSRSAQGKGRLLP